MSQLELIISYVVYKNGPLTKKQIFILARIEMDDNLEEVEFDETFDKMLDNAQIVNTSSNII